MNKLNQIKGPFHTHMLKVGQICGNTFIHHQCFRKSLSTLCPLLRFGYD